MTHNALPVAARSTAGEATSATVPSLRTDTRVGVIDRGARSLLRESVCNRPATPNLFTRKTFGRSGV